MSPRELAAYRAGLRQAAEWALVTALTIELRDDAAEMRQRVAAEALRSFAQGLKAEAAPKSGAGTLEAAE